MRSAIQTAALYVTALVSMACASGPSVTTVSDRPDTPFKLATFEAAGKTRLGLVLGSRVLDIAARTSGSTAARSCRRCRCPRRCGRSSSSTPPSRRGCIRSPTTSRPTPTGRGLRLRQADKVSFKAPIKYPWNLLAASANYRAHAEGMGERAPGSRRRHLQPLRPARPRPPARAASTPRRPRAIVPDRDAPIMFAKSPRSCIIDPDEPFYIVDGRQRTDYEGELAIIMGPRPAYRVPREQRATTTCSATASCRT